MSVRQIGIPHLMYRRALENIHERDSKEPGADENRERNCNGPEPSALVPYPDIQQQVHDLESSNSDIVFDQTGVQVFHV